MKARRIPPGQSGFTLLEMLVAMSVLSIAALALVRLDAFALRSAANLADGGMAAIVANNAATDLMTDPAAPAIGTSTDTVTNGGKAWRVQRIVAATADPALLRIDIAVTGASAAGGAGRAALTIIRPADTRAAALSPVGAVQP
jgi:general secretion pathway protein I